MAETYRYGHERSSRSGMCRCLTCCFADLIDIVISVVCSLIVSAAVIILIWYFVFRNPSGNSGQDNYPRINTGGGNSANASSGQHRRPEPPKGLSNFDWKDIMNDQNGTGDNSTDFWKSEPGHALHLDVLNALNSSWDNIFDEAVSDWNKSEALVLTTIRVPVDPECTFVEGAIKVGAAHRFIFPFVCQDLTQDDFSLCFLGL